MRVWRIFWTIFFAVSVLCAIEVKAEEEFAIFLQSKDTVHISESYTHAWGEEAYFAQNSEDPGTLMVNGAGKIIGTSAVEKDLDNFILEADIRQTACTAASSGVFSIGMRSQGSESTQYRLVYVSALNYNESNHKYGGGTIVRDRLAIARTSGTDNCNSWYYSAVSEKPLGVLNGSATPWIHLRAVMTDDGIEFSAYDQNGVLLSSIASTMDEINMGISGIPVVESGGIMISSHSSDVEVKNLDVTPIDQYYGLSLTPEYRRMYKNQIASVSVTDAEGKTIYPKAIISDEIEDGKVSFHETGDMKARASVKDVVTGETVSAECEIEVLEKIGFTELTAELGASGIVCGGSTECTVFGVSDDGVKYPIDAKITGEGIVVDGTKVSSVVPGDHEIEVSFENLTTHVMLHVANFFEIKLLPCREKVAMWDMLYFNIQSDKEEMLPISPEHLIFKEGSFIIENGRLKANRTGVQTVSAKVDSVPISAEVNVIAKTDGLVLYENFENAGYALSEYMNYNSENLVKQGDNTVYQIENEITDFFGSEDWKDYRIDFKLKIEDAAVEADQYAGVFEIIPRRKIPEHNTFGGDKGIPFVYRTSHNISAPHMRISSIPGPQINIEDGNWHDVSVEVNGCQMIFSIDDKTMYYTGSFPKKGYFSFQASNVCASIDDVEVTLFDIKEPNEDAKITELVSQCETVELPCHDAFNTAALTAVLAKYSDGSQKYLDLLNEVTWEIESGEDIINLSRNRGIKPKKEGQARLLGRVGNKSFFVDITVKDDGLTDEEYVKRNLKQRRETYLYSMQKGFDEGTPKGIGGLGNLAAYYGEMLMYPRIGDYSDLLDWHSLQAEYEDQVVGRGNDGGDFIILQMINIYNKLHGRINASEESFEKMKEYLCGVRYPDPADWMSENHKGVFFATAVLVGETFPEAVMMEGMSGTELNRRYTAYLKTWVNQRLRRGFLEYDSAHYYNVDFYTFENLYAVTNNPELKQLAEDMLNYLYADILVDSLEDTMTGAHSRIYAGMSYTTKFKLLEIQFDLSTIAFDETGVEKAVQDSAILSGEFEPCQAVYDIALEKQKRFANKERRSIYMIPDDLLITDTMEKYTYTTPVYSLGCVVHVDNLEKYRSEEGNYQPITASYPEGTRRNIIQGQQEIPWSLQFAGGSDTMIYEGHPGPYGTNAATHAHGYFAGDLHCNCYQYFQDENVSIGMHKITRAGEVKFTHFWFPRENFQTVYEQGGWIFVNHKGTYAAIKPLRDGLVSGTLYSWGNPNQKYNNAYPLDKVEVRTDSANTAFVCEAHEAENYSSFEEFCNEILTKTHISYSVGADYFLEYTALNGKTIKIDYNNNRRYINGEWIDTHQYKLQDSKYIRADWDLGKINIMSGKSSYEILAYQSELDSETARRIMEQTNSFIKKLDSTSKSRLKFFLDREEANVLGTAKSLRGYQRNKLFELCEEKLEKIAEKLERVGASELAAQIRAELLEVQNEKTTQ